MPSWFHSQDKDGDGQITLAEYARDLTPTGVNEFRRYDRNNDGLITANEIVPPRKAPAPPKTIPAPPEKKAEPAPQPDSPSEPDGSRRRRRG